MRTPRGLLAAALAVAMLLPTTAAATTAAPPEPPPPAEQPEWLQQLPDLPDLPGDLGAIPGLEDLQDVADLEQLLALLDLEGLLSLDGLEPLDPVLDVVAQLVGVLDGLLDPLLGDVPFANTLALQGEDAVDAAIAFSQLTFESADTVLLARDDVFADSLAAGALQGGDAPLLLTPSGTLDRRTAEEITRLGASEVVVLGEDEAIAGDVIRRLEIAGFEVSRAGGATRIETAVEAFELLGGDADTVVLSRAFPAAGADEAQAYVDALAIGPLAAENGWPVLLTQSEVLTGNVARALEGSAVREVLVVGGEDAVSDDVLAQLEELGLSVERVAGPNRFATAVAVAGLRGMDSSADTDRLVLAEGSAERSDLWAPGFAAAAQGGMNGAPILLADTDQVPTETMEFILGGIGDNVATGGPALICASFVDAGTCEAAGRLLVGDLAGGLGILGLLLTDLPNLSELLDMLGLLGALPEPVVALLADLDVVLDQILQGNLVEAVDGLVVTLDGLLGGLLGGDVAGGDLGGGLVDLVDGLLGGVLGDILGGGLLPGVGGGDGGDGGDGGSGGLGDLPILGDLIPGLFGGFFEATVVGDDHSWLVTAERQPLYVPAEG